MATRKNFDTWLQKFSQQIEDIRQFAHQVLIMVRSENVRFMVLIEMRVALE